MLSQRVAPGPSRPRALRHAPTPTPVNATKWRTPPGPGAGSGSHDRWLALVITLLAFLTRAPLAGRSLGESDCARYLLGLEQWLQHGASAPFIYGKVFSPLYYTVAAVIVRHSGWAPLTLLCNLSLWSAVLAAPLVFWLGRQLTRSSIAATGTVLLLLAPGYWWIGIEAHPQQLSFLFLLLALWASLRGDRAARAHDASAGWIWRALAAVAFGTGLLLKNDLVLYAAVFPALHLRFQTGSAFRTRWKHAIASLAVPLGGGLLFILLRPALLGMAFSQAQRQTHAAVREFLVIPHGVELLKQVLPMLTSPGIAWLGLTAIGVALGFFGTGAGAHAWRRRWGWLLAAWALPPILFWGLIHGNNDRHMATFLLLPGWAALELLSNRWARRRQPWALSRALGLAAAGVVVLALNWALVPASSNTSLFVSANVPASQRDLAARTSDLRHWLQAGLTQTPSTCLLGNATLPYLEWSLLTQTQTAGPFPLPEFGPGPSEQIRAGGRTADFVEVNSPAEYRRAVRACRAHGASPRSLEYTPTGLHKQFLGREWRSLPFASRWYPGGR